MTPDFLFKLVCAALGVGLLSAKLSIDTIKWAARRYHASKA